MTGATANKNPATTRGSPPAKKDLRGLEKVRAIFTSLSKYIHAKTIYTTNNPNVARFGGAFHQAFRALFEIEKELVLTIEQYRITWHDEVVYDNDRKNESIAFLLYKDGVGEITFQSTVTQAELDQFVDLIKNEIYNPSVHLDVVSKLWQSEFTNISYRVFDESADGTSGDGRGSGAESREQPLLVNDHRDLPGVDDKDDSDTHRSEALTESLGSYLYGVIDRTHPHVSVHEKEQCVQEMLCSYFTPSSEELQGWRDGLSRANEKNKLLWLLETMLDFTKIPSPPAVVRDVLDIVERLVRYSAEEAHVPTLIALLDIQKKMAADGSLVVEFHSLPGRIKDELTGTAFLIALGKVGDKSPGDVLDVLRYFQMVGKDAVPGLCELLANSKDPSAHKDACDALMAIAGDDIHRIVEELNLDNPYEAKDAVFLLRHVKTDQIPQVIKTLISSPDIQVREHVIDYLAHFGNDEAASLLIGLLEDGDATVRVKTLAGVEQLGHPAIIEKVTAMCFAEDTSAKGSDELERMFRVVGKLGGEKVIDQLRQLTKKKGWLGLGKSQGKQNKLLAITALRHIAGAKSLNMLKEFADDGDSLVRTKAQYVLRQLKEPGAAADDEQSPVGTVEAE
jgi:HEAT repeat protein